MNQLARGSKKPILIAVLLALVAAGVGGAVPAPVAQAVDVGVEGRAGFRVGLPRLAQRPGLQMPGRWIVGPDLAAEAVAADIAFGHDLVAAVAERQLGLGEHLAAPEQIGDLLGRRRKAQQHRAMNGIDRRAALERRVPESSVDGGGLGQGHLGLLQGPLRFGMRGRRAECGAAQQKAASIEGERHARKACYGATVEESR